MKMCGESLEFLVAFSLPFSFLTFEEMKEI